MNNHYQNITEQISDKTIADWLLKLGLQSPKFIELFQQTPECWSENKLNSLIDEANQLLELKQLYQNEELPADWSLEATSWRDQALGAYFNRHWDKTDFNPAYITLQAGAGGIDAAVWCERLAQMYLSFANRHDIPVEIINWQERELNGLRQATLLFSHRLAFAFLKQESGRHRLVHKSPFDKKSRRHTSFATVEVWPKVKLKQSIMDLSDVQIDTFRASGPGGQHRNKVETAIRATHLPTGLQAQISNGRSQGANRAAAIELLASRYNHLQQQLRTDQVSLLRGDKIDTGFGAPRRSYVLDGKARWEDAKLNKKGNNPQKLLNGEIDELLFL